MEEDGTLYNSRASGCVPVAQTWSYGARRYKRTTTEKLDKDGRVIERIVVDEWESPSTLPQPQYKPYEVWCSSNAEYSVAHDVLDLD